MREEQEIRELCARLICQRADSTDAHALLEDEGLLLECRSRIEQVGARLHLPGQGEPICVVDDSGSEELSELSLACLTVCALALQQTSGRRRARLEVSELHRRVGKGGGYTEAYVRRAGLGPLEARGLIKVVKAAQQARAAYIVAGPALSALDVDGLRGHLEQMRAAA